MGRNSSGGGHGSDGGGNYKGKIDNVKSITEMADKKMYSAAKDAISRYHSVLGVRQKSIKLADLGSGVLGCHVTDGVSGESKGVFLNKEFFDRKDSFKKVMEVEKKSYKQGWHNETNKPISHTISHELAHATWNSHLKSAGAKAATKDIQKLHKQWSADTKKKGYGKYGKTNINEFWAELCTKAVSGKADKYTKKAKAIVKKYKL